MMNTKIYIFLLVIVFMAVLTSDAIADTSAHPTKEDLLEKIDTDLVVIFKEIVKFDVTVIHDIVKFFVNLFEDIDEFFFCAFHPLVCIINFIKREIAIHIHELINYIKQQIEIHIHMSIEEAINHIKELLSSLL